MYLYNPNTTTLMLCSSYYHLKCCSINMANIISIVASVLNNIMIVLCPYLLCLKCLLIWILSCYPSIFTCTNWGTVMVTYYYLFFNSQSYTDLFCFNVHFHLSILFRFIIIYYSLLFFNMYLVYDVVGSPLPCTC